jgi:hypothetical protein
VFEYRVLRKIFGPKRGEVTRHWRILCSEELHDLYSSANMQVIKYRRMRWAVHATCMKKGCIQGFGGETCWKEST